MVELERSRQADTLARSRVADALDAGEPLIGQDGRQRSPITLPEYRLGRAPANKGGRYPAEVLTGDEMLALLEAFPERTQFGVRQRALVVVMWRAGLRVAEALALMPKDVDLETGVIVVLLGKGAKRRTVAIDTHGLGYLRAWSQTRARLGLGDFEPLFCTLTQDTGGIGRPLNASTVRGSLKRYAKRAGITKRVHPHGLRHTFAYELAIEGVPVPLIQRQLGHQALEMTAHYIDHLAPADVLNAVRDRHWPGGPPEVQQPPATTAAHSQGAPAFSSGIRPDPHVNQRRQDDRQLPEAHTNAKPGVTKSEILRLVRANRGRATQRQLSRALRLSSTATHVHCCELAAAGQLVRSGKAGTPPSDVWALPPLHASFELQPYARVGSTAERGYGPQRVLDAIKAAGGRGSQAQLAGLVGISPSTVAKHCQLLEAQGKLCRGALDKSTSNRGSQIWALPERQRWNLAGHTLRLPANSSSTSH